MKMVSMIRRAWGLVAALVIPASSGALPLIMFGDGGIVELLPNQAGQTVEIWVTEDTTAGDPSSSSTMVSGFELNMEIGDEGGVGPVITDFDLVTGTIFQDFSPMVTALLNSDRVWQRSVTVFPPSQHIAANGRVATVTFSTEGVTEGEFSLLLKGVTGSLDTKFFNSVPQIETGVPPQSRIQIVPEPTMAGLFVLVTALVIGRRTSRSEELQS